MRHSFCGGAVVAANRFVASYSGSSRQEARFQLLEAVASRLGGF